MLTDLLDCFTTVTDLDCFTTLTNLVIGGEGSFVSSCSLVLSVFRQWAGSGDGGGMGGGGGRGARLYFLFTLNLSVADDVNLV